MPFQKVEFEFPDPDAVEEDTEIEIEPSSEIEVEIPGKEKPVVEEAVELEPELEPELEIVDDVPKKDRNRTPSEPPEDVTEEELENYSDKVRNRIRHFSKGYHDERRAKETAERQTQELETLAQRLLDENKELKGSLSKNKDVLYKQAERAVESDLANATREYKAAYEEGDADKLLKAQQALTKAEIASQRLSKLSSEEALQPNQNTLQTSPENVKDLLPESAKVQVDPRALDWQQKNKWFGSLEHEPETAFALGLHKQITEVEKVSAESDEYYEKLSSRMQAKFPELFEETNEQEVSTPKSKPANVVAPATRSTAPKKIRLTQTQVALAKRLGLTPAQYAKQVALDMRNNNG